MVEEMNWEEPKSVDLVAFEAMCRGLWEEKDKHDELELQAKLQGKKVDELKAKILVIMNDAKIEKFAVSGRGTVFTVDRFSVSVPKDGEGRQAFFEYLKERGIFDELITVNSQTLNAFYKRCLEEAMEKGDVDFKVPGIEEPKHYCTIGLRKGA